MTRPTPPTSAPDDGPVNRPFPGVHGLIRSFGYAIAGVVHLIRSQRNARIHLLVGALVVIVSAWLKIGRSDWAILVLTMASVLILEGLNTAIEAVVDLASPQLHSKAKIAKDVAAGMVLIAAIAAAAIGFLILGPPLWRAIFG